MLAFPILSERQQTTGCIFAASNYVSTGWARRIELDYIMQVFGMGGRQQGSFLVFIPTVPEIRYTVSRMLMKTVGDGQAHLDPSRAYRGIALVERFIEMQPEASCVKLGEMHLY